MDINNILTLGGPVQSRRFIIGAIALGAGLMAGGSYLSSRSAKKSARKTRKMLEALYAEEARRRGEALKIHEQIVATYGPGGTGWETGMGQVAGAVRKGIAGATQGLVSSGLTGTTVKATLPLKAEEQIGMPGREAVLGRYTAALTNQAQVTGQSPFATMTPEMMQGFGGYPGSTTGEMMTSLGRLPFMLALAGKLKGTTTSGPGTPNYPNPNLSRNFSTGGWGRNFPSSSWGGY